MRSRILVVGRDVAVRARLARLSAAGYGVELAESAAHARRIGRKSLALYQSWKALTREREA